MSDGKGLYIRRAKRLATVKFRFHGGEKKIALGHYPDAGLKEARLKIEEALDHTKAVIQLQFGLVQN